MVTALEVIVMAVLVVLVVLAIAGLVVRVVDVASPPFLGVDRLAGVLDDVLAIFVLIELLATAVAYLRGTDVLRRIFEAVFIAIARKLITLDVAAAGLAKTAAVALLLVAAAAAWWLVVRSHEPTE
ncbi:MAG: phosphate-starvation-inducible PsiE family protein [Acidobacteriota bacterium]